MGLCTWDSLCLPCYPPSWSNWLDGVVKWPFEDSFTVPAWWQYVVRLGQGSSEGSMCSESAFNIWCYFFSIARIHRYRNQEVEMGYLTITHSNPLAKVWLSVPVAMLCWFTWFSSRGRNVSTRRYNYSTEFELKTAPQGLCNPHTCKSTSKQGSWLG